MYNNYGSQPSSGGGAAIAGFLATIGIIGGIIALSSNGSSSSSPSSDYYSEPDYYDVPSYVEYDYDYEGPDDYADIYGDYDDDYSSYSSAGVTTWECSDVTSYNKNAYDDNLCVSSTGEVRYTSDSQARALDPSYTPGTSGHYYYNSK